MLVRYLSPEERHIVLLRIVMEAMEKELYYMN